MEKYPNASPTDRELRNLPIADKLEYAAEPDSVARRRAVKRWSKLRARAAATQYYRRLLRHSPNRLRDQQSFEAMGHMMIERSVNVEPTAGRRRLRRRQLLLKWRNFMQATIARW